MALRSGLRLRKDTLIYPTFKCLGCPHLLSQEQSVRPHEVGLTFGPFLLKCMFYIILSITYLPCRSPYTTMYVPIRISHRFSSYWAYYSRISRNVQSGQDSNLWSYVRSWVVTLGHLRHLTILLFPIKFFNRYY